ncbi:CRTAC1 family protein [Pirellulaceae bacterium SH449]
MREVLQRNHDLRTKDDAVHCIDSLSTMRTFAIFCVVWIAGVVALGAPQGPLKDAVDAQGLLFVDVIEHSGIDFEHFSGRTNKHYLIETIASGLATLDFDQDGLIDIYFLNGSMVDGFEYPQEFLDQWEDRPPSNRLYRNRGKWSFSDVTEHAGLQDAAHSVGVAVADVNNDGFPDIFVCNHGQNQLYWNCGDGTFQPDQSDFTNTTVRTAGGASFADIDQDSNLDLLVANYVKFDIKTKIVRTIFGVEASAGPLDYPPDDNILYHNLGDGRFRDITKESGITGVPKTGMGTIAFDFDEDGRQDFFVCNDTMVNQLYLNQGDKVFSEEAILSGVAMNYAGATMASMGVDCADYDNDGRMDLIISNFENEIPVLYKGQGNGLFDDVAVLAGLGLANKNVKWGISMADFDNDSIVDLYIANGHLIDTVNSLSDTVSFAAKNLLFRGTPQKRFVDVSKDSGPGMQVVEVSRGVCVDDLDNDGKLDIVILNFNSRPTLLRNDSSNEHHWIQIRTIGTKSNRDGVGASVKVRFGDQTRIAGVFSGRGYQSSYGRSVHFGLGEHSDPVDVEIVWPSGASRVYHNLDVDRVHLLYE